MKTYRDLHAWKLAMDVVVEVYAVTRTFPADEKYGLTSQMRRSSVSVAACIAEGYGRRTRGEYLNSLSHANGSQFELETEIIAASRLGYLSDDELLDKCEHSGRVLNRLIASLSQSRVADGTGYEALGWLPEGPTPRTPGPQNP